MQSTLDPPAQGLRSRDASKPQVGTKTASIQRSSSPKPSLGSHASQGLLSKGSSSSHVTRLSPPVGQFIINTLLQIAGFAAAIAFGIYAIQSVTVGKDANQSANIANRIALLGLCLQGNNETDAINSFCSRVIYYANTILPVLASTVFPDLPSTVPSPTTISPSSTTTSPSTSTTNYYGLPSVMPSLTMTSPSTSPTGSPDLPTSTPLSHTISSGVLIAIIIGTLVGLFITGFITFVWIKRRRFDKYGPATQTTTASQEEKLLPDNSVSIMQKFRKIFVETRVITETQR